MWQVTPAGPFDHWPTGLGFEHFYDFNQAADSQYYPRILNRFTGTIDLVTVELK
jgi:arylsulfatase